MPQADAGRAPGERARVLVDDHALFRTGVANIINQEPDLRVVAEAATASRRSRPTSAIARTSPCWISGCQSWKASKPFAESGNTIREPG